MSTAPGSHPGPQAYRGQLPPAVASLYVGASSVLAGFLNLAHISARSHGVLFYYILEGSSTLTDTVPNKAEVLPPSQKEGAYVISCLWIRFLVLVSKTKF